MSDQIPANTICAEILRAGIERRKQKRQSSLAQSPDEVGPGRCDGCKQEHEYVLTIMGGVKLCRGCLEAEHPNAEVSEGETRDSRIETAAQSRPPLH